MSALTKKHGKTRKSVGAGVTMRNITGVIDACLPILDGENPPLWIRALVEIVSGARSVTP